MELLESLDNFIKRTLAVVPGLWHKLAYMGGLRKDSGEYDQWGLSKRYGNEATKSALSAAHEQVFLDVLRKPVRNLLDEAEENAAEKEIPAEEYVEELWLSRKPMTPDEVGGVVHVQPGHASRVLGELATLREIIMQFDVFPLGIVNPEVLEVNFQTRGVYARG